MSTNSFCTLFLRYALVITLEHVYHYLKHFFVYLLYILNDTVIQ